LENGGGKVSIYKESCILFPFSWGKVLSHIYSMEDTGPYQAGKMKDKDRAVIKEKFAVSICVQLFITGQKL